MKEIIKNRLSPFGYKDFRRFFIVKSLSSIGKWSHDLARAWIVVEMFGKASALGSLLLATSLPALAFILYAGVLVDRLNVKAIFMMTTAFLAVASLALGFLVEFSEIQFWHLLIFGVIEGFILAFQSPAFQALTVRLVPREEFQQALALNSMNFHLGRTLGPLVAGAVMAWKGPGAVFFLDGLMYICLFGILIGLSLRPAQRQTLHPKRSFQSLVDGLQYIWKTPYMRYKVIQLMGAIALIFPVMIVVFRTFITEKFNLSSEEFGYAFMWPAFGSALGSISFTIVKPERPLRVLLIGVPLTAISLVAVPYADTLNLACALMSLCGLAVYLSFVSLTISLHLDVEEDFRGRMGSLIGMGFLCIGPLMSFPAGVYADWAGFKTSVITVSLAYLLLSGSLAFLHWRSWEAIPQAS